MVRLAGASLSSGYLQSYRPNAWADFRHVAKEGAGSCLNRDFLVSRCPCSRRLPKARTLGALLCRSFGFSRMSR